MNPLGPGWQRQVTVALLWIAGLLLLYLGLKYVVPHFLPFMLAVALAVLIDPTVDALEERLRLPRGWAVAITLVFLLGLLLGLVFIGVGAVVVQVGQLAVNLPTHIDRVMAFSQEMLAGAAEVFSGLPEDIVAYLETSIRAGLDAVYTAIDAVAKAVLSGLKGLPQVFLVLVISLVATFFISRDKILITEFVLSLLPANWRQRARLVNRDVLNSIVGLIKAQLALVGLTTLITVTALYVLDVRYAWLVGLLTGILDVLPVVGPATVLVPWALYALIDGNVPLGAGLGLLYVVITVFRQIMEPKVIGERIGLHPLVTLLSLYLGIRLLGATGLVVGPLVAIVIKAVVRSGRPPAGGSHPRGRTPPKSKRYRGLPAESPGEEQSGEGVPG